MTLNQEMVPQSLMAHLTDFSKNSRVTIYENNHCRLYRRKKSMKKNILTTTAFCVTIISTSFTTAEDKASVAMVKKDTQIKTIASKETPESQKLSAADFISEKDITLDITVKFIEALTVMGEGDPGLEQRQALEAKRNLSSQEIQEESRDFEKAKNDYIAKSTTMSDPAREKEEKKLVKMERDIKNLVAEKEDELKLDMQLATETLARELETAVAQLAKEENIDVVFDKMTGRAIYVSEKLDYTAQAIDRVNKNHQVKLAQLAKAENATKLAENKTTAPKAAKVGA
jgi:Skp family chaperone for outer membrane proteins